METIIYRYIKALSHKNRMCVKALWGIMIFQSDKDLEKTQAF